MAKTWVLDTETKGTGANVVPLDKLKPAAEPSRDRFHVPRKHVPRPAGPPAPKPPRAFKVVDLVSRQVLTEGADTRATVDVLKNVRSIVDVAVYAWQPAREKWRLLGIDELRLLWRYRDA